MQPLVTPVDVVQFIAFCGVLILVLLGSERAFSRYGEVAKLAGSLGAVLLLLALHAITVASGHGDPMSLTFRLVVERH